MIILFSCNSSFEGENENIVVEDHNKILTREDSVINLAKDLNIKFDLEKDNINEILDKILDSKKSLIAKLDSLDKRADEMESLAYQYKKKENTRIKNELLSEISRIKNELNRIKALSNKQETTEIIKKDSFSIPEIKVPKTTSSFENLPPGNYITRLDNHHIISIHVKNNGEIIMGKPKKDSTTVISGGRKLDGRISKELEQVRKKMK